MILGLVVTVATMRTDPGDAVAEGLFGDSAVLTLQRRLGICGGRPQGAWLEAAWAVCFGWLPLLLICSIGSQMSDGGSPRSFLTDRAIHARSLVAAVILIMSRPISYRQLTATCAHFINARLISPSDEPRFRSAIASTRRLEASAWAMVARVGLAYVVVYVLAASTALVPAWHAAQSGWFGRYSFAGAWHVLVSLPIVLSLLLGWFWRLLLWARLLWIVSRLRLELVPSHPDRAAGLSFVGHAVRSFTPMGFALGLMVAGSLANRVLQQGVSLATYRDTSVVLVVLVLVVFHAPLATFLRPLWRAWQRGVYQYGSFAHGMGQDLERKWLARARPDASVLRVQDFSALHDYYQSVSNVYAMRVLPVDPRTVVMLAIATVLPILLVAATNLPFGLINDYAGRVLF